MNDLSITTSGLLLELRRGTIVVAILAKLQQPKYGYALVSSLEQSGIAVETGTLYPLLRRLEAQGLLESSWDTEEARPRKYYRLSEGGAKAYAELVSEWSSMSGHLATIIKEESV